MGKVKVHLEGRSKEDRAKQRQTVGTLGELTVQPKTRQRYRLAKQKLYTYLRENPMEIPRQTAAFDDMLSDYMWSIYGLPEKVEH